MTNMDKLTQHLYSYSIITTLPKNGHDWVSLIFLKVHDICSIRSTPCAESRPFTASVDSPTAPLIAQLLIDTLSPALRIIIAGIIIIVPPVDTDTAPPLKVPARAPFT